MIALSLFEGALNLSWHSVRETVRKEPLVQSKIGMMKQLSGMDGSAGKSYQAVAEAGTATIQGAPAYPTTMVLAVLVDAAVDGFLIGISAASGTNAGLIMAIVWVEINHDAGAGTTSRRRRGAPEI